MRIVYAILLFLGPRVAFLLYWRDSAEYVQRVSRTEIWPLLGLLFLPWTTLVYMLAYGYNAIVGEDWIWLGAAVAVDVATYAGAVYYRVKGENAMTPIKWVERSRVVRVLFYLLMLVIGFFGSVYSILGPLLGDGAAFEGFMVRYLAFIFLVFVFLGFVFCFVDPDMPWLPALLLTAPGLLIAAYFSGEIIPFVLWAAAAAALGAYLGGLLLKRGKQKASAGLERQPEA